MPVDLLTRRIMRPCRPVEEFNLELPSAVHTNQPCPRLESGRTFRVHGDRRGREIIMEMNFDR